MDFGNIIGLGLQAAVAPEALLYCIAAIGLNIQFGYAGLLNFGQAAFVGVGAYGLALGITTLGIGLWASLFLGIAGAVVLALLLGVPTLRLRADYLSICTIAAAEIFRLIMRSSGLTHVTGGPEGMQGFVQEFRALSPYGPGSVRIGSVLMLNDQLWVVTVGWVLVVLLCLFVWLLVRSPWGRVLKSIREDEDAARSLGKNVFSYKMQALVLGGVIGALAGFVGALGTANVQPDTYKTDYTFFIYTVLLLGGAARVLGPVLGSLIFAFGLSVTDSLLRGLLQIGVISSSVLSSQQLSQVRWILMGLLLVILMIFRPQGILGDKKEIQVNAR